MYICISQLKHDIYYRSENEAKLIQVLTANVQGSIPGRVKLYRKTTHLIFPDSPPSMHAALRNKMEYCLARSKDYVNRERVQSHKVRYKWIVGLDAYKADIINPQKITFCRHDITEKLLTLTLNNNNHSFTYIYSKLQTHQRLSGLKTSLDTSTFFVYQYLIILLFVLFVHPLNALSYLIYSSNIK